MDWIKALLDIVALEVHRKKNALFFYKESGNREFFPGVVEFFGPRGVGKSTLFQSVIQQDGFSQTNIDRLFTRAEKNRIQRNYAAKYADFIAFFLSQYENSMISSSMKKRRIRWTHQSLDFHGLVEESKIPGVFLQDEHFCQRGLSLALSRPDATDLDQYFDLMPKSKGVVIVSASKNLIEERQLKRDHKIWADEYTVAMQSIETLKHSLEKRRIPYLLLDLDINRHHEKNVGVIQSFVANIANSFGPVT